MTDIFVHWPLATLKSALEVGKSEQKSDKDGNRRESDGRNTSCGGFTRWCRRVARRRRLGSANGSRKWGRRGRRETLWDGIFRVGGEHIERVVARTRVADVTEDPASRTRAVALERSRSHAYRGDLIADRRVEHVAVREVARCALWVDAIDLWFVRADGSFTKEDSGVVGGIGVDSNDQGSVPIIRRDIKVDVDGASFCQS